MDDDQALGFERNRATILRILSGLFVRAGLAEGGTVGTLPRHVHFYILRILRPAESAVRRLVVMLAREITVEPVRGATGRARAKAGRKTSVPAVSALPLLDRRKNYFAPLRRRPRCLPRIWVLGGPDPVFPSIRMADDEVDAGPVCRRLKGSSARSTIFRDRPGASRAGRPGATATRTARARARHCASGCRPAFDGGPSTKSTACCGTVTSWRSTR